ncbi:flavin prenyltransferase UbiX [Paenibacillus marchantiophytorum]|uniref:Flavin prenyltransferase UbiX n=1 Tax=Paenibacillus marchantiophytorum TaxID=1619310 RepID=A0ABQ1EVU7_9BACL|nr:flavin prenyltransferase UbiX [Paenibacillus marchantiophytorum]GFZ89702.1 flavin prenyltransferase UbiX [Paenibacillus marchantiophytorum]
MSGNWVIGITGASGAAYGVRLIQVLLDLGMQVHVIITEAGWRVLHDELDWQVTKRKEMLQQHFGNRLGAYEFHPIADIGASVASGSFRTKGMVVIPCSMGTLSGIAHGSSDNLLERTADVMLKEGRKLILVPRETPLHAIHLENMLTLSKMGVRMLPAMPAFYNRPRSIEEMVDFLVGKVLDSMEIEHSLYRRWGEDHEQPRP